MELDDVLAAIADGDLDGSLDQLVAAVVARVQDGRVRFPWRIRFDGDEWTEQSVTAGEMKFAEGVCYVDGVDDRGRPFRRRATRHEINPRGTAEHAIALLVAHLHKVKGLSLKDAVARAEAVTADELDEMVDEYEVVRPPKDDSGPSTTS